MDMALISSFYSSLDEGLKGENDWKPQAYEAAKEHINTTLRLNLTKENVRNRYKTMKKHYGYVNGIQTVESGLLWDNEKKMVLVTSDTLHIWENYLKVQPLAAPYKNKMIEFGDDIVVLCALEKATGQHAENFEDAIDSMAAEIEDEMNSPSTQIPAQQDSTEGSSQRKKRKKDPLFEIVGEMATSLKEYVEMKKNQERPKPTGEEIYGVVSKISSASSIYDHLQRNGLPMGLLPKGITEFSIDPETHLFQVNLSQPCNAKFENQLHYDFNISGVLSFGKIANLSGVSQQELFLWFPVISIRVDDPSSGLINFDVGVVDKQFSMSLFESPRDCTAVDFVDFRPQSNNSQESLESLGNGTGEEDIPRAVS
ncbi:hypothetical protein CCACVL1_10670 [Corchorus capsularis]|uniref:Myb/SANT-like domain-containing protein n=1 Tax=Corchorus capsularis TaxID=210143 RepID=A0A1R3IQ93_COCAP|nr:hypothetical protein CCACVL1_10670 [Corchorus capsularis]